MRETDQLQKMESQKTEADKRWSPRNVCSGVFNGSSEHRRSSVFHNVVALLCAFLIGTLVGQSSFSCQANSWRGNLGSAATQQTRVLDQTDEVHTALQLLSAWKQSYAVYEQQARDALQLFQDNLARYQPDQVNPRAFESDDRIIKDRYIWDYFAAPIYNCPDKQWLGPVGDGGKAVCGMHSALQRKGCVIYSIGINGNIVFDKEIIARTNCDIFMFDPFITQQDMDAHLATLNTTRARGFLIGVAGHDHVAEDGKVFKTIPSLMRQFGHTWLDILKIDVEGAEYETFDVLWKEPCNLNFSQVLMEAHWDSPPAGRRFDVVTKLLLGFWNNGFRAFHQQYNIYWCPHGGCIELAYLRTGHADSKCPGPPPPKRLLA